MNLGRFQFLPHFNPRLRIHCLGVKMSLFFINVTFAVLNKLVCPSQHLKEKEERAKTNVVYGYSIMSTWSY